MFNKRKKVVSFLVSGRGSNFKAVAEKIISGYINANIGIVISDSGNSLALEKASELGIESIVIEAKKFKTREEHEKGIVKILVEYKTDLVVAAGYMRLLTPFIINHFRHRIINIHPSILPSFPGKNAQQQAFDYGVKITGCTTHFIDEGIDTGPIILQAPVEITSKDGINSLSTKILIEEHKILAESVKLFCEDRLTVTDHRVIIKD
jgi:phosphoribosylglycinamide formyltransferase 1